MLGNWPQDGNIFQYLHTITKTFVRTDFPTHKHSDLSECRIDSSSAGINSFSKLHVCSGNFCALTLVPFVRMAPLSTHRWGMRTPSSSAGTA